MCLFDALLCLVSHVTPGLALASSLQLNTDSGSVVVPLLRGRRENKSRPAHFHFHFVPTVRLPIQVMHAMQRNSRDPTASLQSTITNAKQSDRYSPVEL